MFLLIVVLILSLGAKADRFGSISGKVLSLGDKRPLPGVEVSCYLHNLRVGHAITDSEGEYHFSQFTPGTYKMTFSLKQYEQQTIKKVKVKAGKAKVQNSTIDTSLPFMYFTEIKPKTTEEKLEVDDPVIHKGRLAIRVRDDQGSPLQYVNVVLMQDNSRITGGQTNEKGTALIINIPPGTYAVKFSLVGYATQTMNDVMITADQIATIPIIMKRAGIQMGTVKVLEKDDIVSMQSGSGAYSNSSSMPYPPPTPYKQPVPPFNTEDYDPIKANIFHSPLAEPLSTFSIDVDTADYSNIRRILNQGSLPEPNSVRIEELLNYFAYDYPQPTETHPFAVYTEMSVCPWNQKRNLVHIGIQGKKLDLSKAPASNLVFLIDVSGSMNSMNKLPLVKESMQMLVENLRGKDKVAIVVYAGAAGEVLPSTGGNQKLKINQAIDNLQAGGSTAGGAGIQLAYKIAEENFIHGGNNRIILCTDGDFNVGASSDAHLSELIEEKRSKGVYLTVLGYGMGNYKDNKLELLADKGNGNYAYIDNLKEAKKFLVNEMASTLYAIAKDVKLQVEFNPAHVKAYRLIGYENRLLNKEDFKDDTKDAGELGAGHNVTAVYEIIPTSSKEQVPELDELKYQELKLSDEARNSPEALTVNLRYKLPDGDTSIPLDVPVKNITLPLEKASENYLFSAAVIGYGLMLQNSEYKGALTWQMVKDLAKANLGKDSEGYRAEFVNLVELAAKLGELQEREENRDYNKGY